MGNYCVNRSGRTFTITRTNGGSDVIGTLYPNEIFAWTGSWNGNHTGVDYQSIYFRNSSGVPTHGWLSGPSGTNCLTLLPTFRYQMVTWNGKQYYAFKLRRAEEYYNSSGGLLGTIPAGRLILTDRNATCGQSNPGLMNFYAFQVSGSTYANVGSAFIDAGLSAGSTLGSNASFIGSFG